MHCKNEDENLEAEENLQTSFENKKQQNLECNQATPEPFEGQKWTNKLPPWIFPFLGLLLAAFSSALFSVSNVIVKLLEGVDPFTITFYRFVAILILSLPSVVWAKTTQGTAWFQKGFRWALVTRSILGSINLGFHFYALKHLPIADTNLIAASAPIFTVIFSRIFLKEKMFKIDLLNIGLVIAGIILIVKPPFIFKDLNVYEKDSEMVIAIILLLVGALMQANVYVLLRFLKDIQPDIILFNFGWIGSIISGIISLAFGCRCFPNTVNEWLWLLLMGLVSYIAQIGLTTSAQFESATKVAIYRKSFDIIFAFLFQILLFHDMPDNLKIVGALLITGAVLVSGINKHFQKK